MFKAIIPIYRIFLGLESRVILGEGHVDSRIQVYLKSDLYMATVHSLNVKVAYGAYHYARLLRILMFHCRCSLQWQIQEAPLIRCTDFYTCYPVK